jgi:Zn-dependent protease
MASWANYIDKVKRYVPFSNTEWKGFALLTIVFALTLSFTEWGAAAFDVQEGLKNFLVAFIIVGISVAIHHFAQRLTGVWYGYRIEHNVWWAGMLVGLFALFLTNGRMMVFAASSMRAHFMPQHRIGAFRYGPSLRQIGASALMGPVTAVIIAFLVSQVFSGQWASDFLKFNLLFAFFCMLPLPPLDGLHVFVGARTSYGGSFTYFFTVCGFIGFFLVYLLAGVGFFLSLLAGLIMGFVGWFAFDVLVEK